MSIEGQTSTPRDRFDVDNLSYVISIQNIHTVLQNENSPFGQVLSGALTLAGRLKPAAFIFPADFNPRKPMEELVWKVTICRRSHKRLQIYLDERPGAFKVENIFCLPVTRNLSGDQFQGGLLLKYLRDENVYARKYMIFYCIPTGSVYTIIYTHLRKQHHTYAKKLKLPSLSCIRGGISH